MGDDWCKCEWGDIITLMYGKALRDYRGIQGKYPVYGTNGPIGWHDDFLCSHPGVIVGRKGAYRGIHFSPKPFFVIDTAFYLEPKNEMDLHWAYYKLLTYDINSMDSGSAIPSTSKDSFYRLPVMVPSLPEQRAIAAILSALDDKIELNRQMNKTLEEMAQTIFKHWFVDFGPFRDGGMQDSELGPIPVGWQVGTLGDVTEILDSRRIPLSGQERILRQGPYPYYGAATIMDHIDDYIYDGIYLLIAEDGSVVDAQGGPVLQYAWGKFWVNNHAHVLRGSNNYSVEQLYLLLRLTNVRPYITGAVQLKINQANLKRIPVIIPPREIIDSFNMLISDQFAMIRSKTDETAILVQLRDTLLPKLMSGELRVPVSDNAG